jgi:hypothetical protein
MRLRHADALVLRGRIALDQQASELAAAEALDDAGAALTIAGQCGYAWAERDAAGGGGDDTAVDPAGLGLELGAVVGRQQSW